MSSETYRKNISTAATYEDDIVGLSTAYLISGYMYKNESRISPYKYRNIIEEIFHKCLRIDLNKSDTQISSIAYSYI